MSTGPTFQTKHPESIVGLVLRDNKGLRGPWFYSFAKTFLPTALECCWDTSQPCGEVAMDFMRSDLGSRVCVSVAVTDVRAAHLETPWPDGLMGTPQPGSGQAPRFGVCSDSEPSSQLLVCDAGASASHSGCSRSLDCGDSVSLTAPRSLDRRVFCGTGRRTLRPAVGLTDHGL